MIAGDLYDGDCRDFNTGLYLTKQSGRLREEKIPVFVIAGNHDAANKMTRALALPDNVRMLGHDRPGNRVGERSGRGHPWAELCTSGGHRKPGGRLSARGAGLHQHRAVAYGFGGNEWA